MSEHDQLDTWLRQSQKLSEEERSIMQDEPCDVIKNLELLTALRKASEAEAPPNRSSTLNKSRKKRSEIESSATDSPSASGVDKTSRSKGGVPRSTSVSSNQARDARSDGVAVKIEEGSEGTKGTMAERSGLLVVGALVVFKHNKNKQGVEGEGIQCIIKNISGDGHKKRYVHTLIQLYEYPQLTRLAIDGTTCKTPNPMKTARRVLSLRLLHRLLSLFHTLVPLCLPSPLVSRS